jgi:hypothetical protein
MRNRIYKIVELQRKAKRFSEKLLDPNILEEERQRLKKQLFEIESQTKALSDED